LQAFSAGARPSDAPLMAGKGNPKFLESLQVRAQ
jgi:hypothetical protein